MSEIQESVYGCLPEHKTDDAKILHFKGEAPANKYVYVSLTVFDKKLQEHMYKIYYKVVEARAKNPNEKRPNLHVTGELRNVRDYEGKAYEDVTVRDASPLIWTPLGE